MLSFSWLSTTIESTLSLKYCCIIASASLLRVGDSVVVTSLPGKCVSYHFSLASHFLRYLSRSHLPRCSQYHLSPLHVMVKSGRYHESSSAYSGRSYSKLIPLSNNRLAMMTSLLDRTI